MAKYELCKNIECKKRYQCKRYCTPPESGEERIDFDDKCNEENEYSLYIDWKSKREIDN
jgi:translation initiation factor RLI1